MNIFKDSTGRYINKDTNEIIKLRDEKGEFLSPQKYDEMVQQLQNRVDAINSVIAPELTQENRTNNEIYNIENIISDKDREDHKKQYEEQKQRDIKDIKDLQKEIEETKKKQAFESQPQWYTSKESGIIAYKIEDKLIDIRFKNGSKYRYGVTMNNPQVIDRMKQLARQNHGLNTFINKFRPKTARMV